MAGSLNHLVAPDGSFRFDLIDHMGDAHEACEECFDIIAALLEETADPREALSKACMKARAPSATIPVFGTRHEKNEEEE